MFDYVRKIFDKKLKVFVEKKEKEKIGNIFDQSKDASNESHYVKQNRVVIGPIYEIVDDD